MLGARGGEEPVARFCIVVIFILVMSNLIVVILVMFIFVFSSSKLVLEEGRSQWQGFANCHLCSLLFISPFFILAIFSMVAFDIIFIFVFQASSVPFPHNLVPK